MKKIILLNCIALIGFFLMTVMGEWAYSQDEVNIGLGTIRLNINKSHRPEGGGLRFPQEYSVYGSMSCVQGFGLIMAARDFEARWYYPTGNNDSDWYYVGDGNPPDKIPFFALDATSYYYEDNQHTTVPIELTRYWLYDLPRRIVNETDWSEADWQGVDEVNENMFCEQMVEARVNTSLGLTFIQKAYAFTNPDYDDFVIVEYIFKNTGNIDDSDEIEYPDNKINACYVGLKMKPQPTALTTRIVSNAGGWNEQVDDWIDYYGKTYADWVAGGTGDSLRVLYGWDGDASSNYYAPDDEGDPLPSSGIFMSPQYPGMAILHVDRAVGDPTDDPSQPSGSHYSWGGARRQNVLSPKGMAQEQIWNIMSNAEYFNSPFDWDTWNSSQTEIWNPVTGFDGDPNVEWFKFGTLKFGPYEFNNVGDSIRIVACYTVGSISWTKRIELGEQWKNGTISETEKNTILRSGRDSLFARISQVRSLFKKADGTYDFSMTKGSAIDQKIDNPPKWPDVAITSEIGGIKLEWSDVSADAYKVYRRSKAEFTLDDPGVDVYLLVYEAPGNVFEWTDTDASVGRNYWYYVTAVKNGIESSPFVNRTSPSDSDPLEESASPFQEPPRTLDNVHVVPNPYHAHATRLYDWTQDLINFVGLPASCRIRIYTQTGDLVATLEHIYEPPNPPSSTEQWLQITESDQYIASGLYIYVIDQTVDHEGNELGETKVGKFAIIR